MKSVIASFFSFLLFLMIAAAGAVWWVENYYASAGPLAAPGDIVLERGTGVRQIAEQLEASGVILHPDLFFALAVATGDARKMQAGEYAFPAGVSPRDIIAMMVQGKTVKHVFTVPEGWTTAQIIRALMQIPQLKGEIPQAFAEGELLPETYQFAYGDSRLSLLQRMRDAMQKVMVAAAGGPVSPYGILTPVQLLTLASIVEKETHKPSERPRIAGLYLNRLRLGMKLQADPTVIYALTKGQEDLGRALSLADLNVNSPYNTYRYAGLPPGPICNPGKASIEAARNPLPTDELYFVADGTGGHRFAKTEKEHEANVRAFRQWEAASRKASNAPPPD